MDVRGMNGDTVVGGLEDEFDKEKIEWKMKS